MKTRIHSLWTSLILLIAVLTSTPAGATGDVLSFEADTAGYSFLVYSGGGPNGIGGLVMTWPNIAERGLPSENTQWYFKPSANHLRIVFTNPGRTDLPPSFTLEIKGKARHAQVWKTHDPRQRILVYRLAGRTLISFPG